MAPDKSAVERRAALTTPRAAAFAGIAFGILYGASLLLVGLAMPPDGTVPPDAAWVDANGRWIHLALSLVPFAGVAFLWFIGVIRDRLGALEDRFFATIFLGSGLLFVVLTFVGAALASGLLASYEGDPSELISGGVYSYARAVMYNVITIYANRMAGVFMLTLGSIWLRTALMQRTWAFVTFALAVVLLVGYGDYRLISLVFPGWVLAVGLYILIRNVGVRLDDTVDSEEAG